MIQRKQSVKHSERLRNSKLSVREFRSHSEVEDLLPLTREYHREVAFVQGEYDELMVRVSLGALLNNTTRHYENLFICYLDDRAVGFLLASIGCSLYADTKVAHEDLLYVTPRARGTRAFLLLHDTYEQWARDEGACAALTGSNNIRSSEKTAKLLDKLGYRQIGVTFVKEL